MRTLTHDVTFRFAGFAELPRRSSLDLAPILVCSNCQAVSSNHPALATNRLIEKMGKMCMAAQTFEKTVSEYSKREMVAADRKFYNA